MTRLLQVSIAAAALASTVYAQYIIDPSSVPNSTRIGWCSQQQAQCPLICLQTEGNSLATDANTCDPTTLTYACVCSNGISPNVSEYSQTLPYYICQEWGNQCVNNCNGDSTCQGACRDNHPCGAQNPQRVNSSTISTSTTSGSATGTAGAATTTAQFTGFAAGGSPTGAGAAQNTGKTSDAVRVVQVWALGMGQTFGTAAVLGALFGGFAVLL